MRLFSDDTELLNKLSEKGNPLERLDKAIDWQEFLPILTRIFANPTKNPSIGGRPHLDFLMMFKTLLLQRLNNLSDDAMEYQLLDRLSFRQFVGCDDSRVPDAKTIWLYRERLSQLTCHLVIRLLTQIKQEFINFFPTCIHNSFPHLHPHSTDSQTSLPIKK